MKDITDSAYVNVFFFFLYAFQKTQKEVIRLKVILRNFFFLIGVKVIFLFWKKQNTTLKKKKKRNPERSNIYHKGTKN